MVDCVQYKRSAKRNSQLKAAENKQWPYQYYSSALVQTSFFFLTEITCTHTSIDIHIGVAFCT